MSSFLTYALNFDGNLVHIDSVANGIKCNCFCPHCKDKLCAKNGGEDREHHFAHVNKLDCEGAYETSLHLLAKEILQEERHIMLPYSNNRNYPSGLVALNDVEAERYDSNYKIRPDAEGILPDGRRLLIEFFVSHKVDKEKRAIIINNHLLCIEVAIHFPLLTKNELRDFLINSSEGREWVDDKYEEKESNKDYLSNSSKRNPIYDRIRDCLKESFDNNTLLITPKYSAKGDRVYGHLSLGQKYDLRELGYDTCVVGFKSGTFKSDLLLYRSKSEKKGYISINIRGRKRKASDTPPGDYRVIDIIIKDPIPNLEKLFISGIPRDTPWFTVQYQGFILKEV